MSKLDGVSIPLLYPEAMLFPTIFWKQNEDGSFPGAIPSFLFGNSTENAKYGFAGLHQLLQSRITNGSHLTSTSQHYASFVFDCFMNEHMNEDVSRNIVFRRGWDEELQEGDGIRRQNSFIKLDAQESRRNVNKIAAALAESPAQYFLTLTCNMAQHFGVAPYFHALEDFFGECSGEFFDAAIQSSMGLFCRLWDRAIHYLMGYIEHSHEQPCVPVERIWSRVEFQTTKGNLPHIHCLIWTKEDKSSQEVQSRIVCNHSNLYFQLVEDDKLKKLGMITDAADGFEKYLQCVRFYHHSCEDCDR